MNKFPTVEEARKWKEDYLAGKVPARGLGDVVAKMTQKMGIKPCGGCKKRQQWLNEKFPFKLDSDTPAPDTHSQSPESHQSPSEDH